MYKRYWCLCKTAESSPYSVIRVFIEADNPYNARKLLEAQYGSRILGAATPC